MLFFFVNTRYKFFSFFSYVQDMNNINSIQESQSNKKYFPLYFCTGIKVVNASWEYLAIPSVGSIDCNCALSKF